MKVLLREWRYGEKCIWKDATYNGKNKGWLVDGHTIIESEILSVLNDDAPNYVRCSVCGKVFQANSDEARQHTNAQVDVNQCFKCQNLRERDVCGRNTVYIAQDGSTFAATDTRTCTLECMFSYPYQRITPTEMPSKCIHLMCNGASMEPLSTFFTRYPGAFDAMITVDKLIEMGCEEEGNLSYRVKGRNTLNAHVNSIRVVDMFILHYNRRRYVLNYSKKYNKVFGVDNGTYNELSSYTEIPAETAQYITKKIATLYDGIEVENNA